MHEVGAEEGEGTAAGNDMNVAIVSANRRLGSAALVSAIVVLMFGFMISMWTAGPGTFDLYRSLRAFGALAGLSEQSRVDPSGLLGALGAVAIAGSLALVENVRRLGRRDSRSDPARRRRELEGEHAEQIITLVEFGIAGMICGGAVVLTAAFALAGEVVLAFVAGSLAALLWVSTWRFLVIFYRMDTTKFRWPAGPLADRLNSLLRVGGWRRWSPLFWFAGVVVMMWLNALSLAGVGVERSGAAVLSVVSVGAGFFATQSARSAVFEFGVARAVTVFLGIVTASFFACGLPVLSVFGREDTAAEVSDEATMGFLLTVAVTLLFVAARAADRAAILPRWSSAGLSLNERLVLPPRPRRYRASGWIWVGWFVGVNAFASVPAVVLGGGIAAVLAIACVSVVCGAMAGLGRWATGARGLIFPFVAGALGFLLTMPLFGLALEQAERWAMVLFTGLGILVFYTNLFVTMSVGAGPGDRVGLGTDVIDHIQRKNAAALHAKLRALDVRWDSASEQIVGRVDVRRPR